MNEKNGRGRRKQEDSTLFLSAHPIIFSGPCYTLRIFFGFLSPRARHKSQSFRSAASSAVEFTNKIIKKSVFMLERYV